MNSSVNIKTSSLRLNEFHIGFTSLFALLILVFSSLMSSVQSQHLDVPVHDPVMIQQDDQYYLFATGRGIAVWTSDDMENWERLDPIFEEAPGWTETIVEGGRYHLWAPDITYHDGMYYLYYSVSDFGRNTSAIGVLSTASLHPDDSNYGWTDHGQVVRSVPGRDLWNAIDPNIAFDDEGTPWMTFGSFWKGMKLVRLNENMIETDNSRDSWYTIAARHRYWKLDDRDAGDEMNSTIEAPFIFKKNGYYYNFVSWDVCCRGEESTYKVVVGRSENIIGPYFDKEGENMAHGGGSLVIQGDENYAGIGHQSAYTFDGTDYLIAHGYDLSNEGRAKLIIFEMTWDENGWPVVDLYGEVE